MYAEHFDLFRQIQFNTLVTQVVPVEGETYWDVTVRLSNGGEETRRYQGIIIANGHLSNSKYPTYPGTFTG